MLESRIPSIKTIFSKPKKILVSRWFVDIDGQDLILVEEWGGLGSSSGKDWRLSWLLNQMVLSSEEIPSCFTRGITKCNSLQPHLQ